MLKLLLNSRFSARRGTSYLFAWLFFCSLFSLNSYAQSSFVQTATVTSDKEDYAPRSNAVFTGTGFSPGETVILKVKNLNKPCNTISSDSSYLPWSVTADTIGGFVTNWTVCNCPGDSLRLKATGQTSGLVAYAYFTDANSSISLNSPASAAYGSMLTLEAILSQVGGSGNGALIPNRQISFSINNGTYLGASFTNSMGKATLEVPVTLNVGTYNGSSNGIKATFSGDPQNSNPFYSNSSKSNNFEITKATIDISQISGSGIYGEPLVLSAKLNLNISNIPVNFSLNGTPVGTGNTNQNGEVSLSVPFLAIPVNLRNAGNYTDVIGISVANSTNYGAATGAGILNINQRPITITADAKSKTYGDANPVLTAMVTNGSIVSADNAIGALSRVAGENVGDYAIGKGTFTFGSNYQETFVGANFRISARPISIAAEAKTKVYGNADPVLIYQITSGNLVGSDNFNGSLSRSAGEAVGTFSINQGTVSLSSNYLLTFASAELTITPRSITVAADAKTKIYGDADPALTYTITYGNLVFNDALSGNLGRAAGENVGTFEINQGTLSAGLNYNLTFLPENLTISVRAITIAADAKTKIYGDTDPAFTFHITSGNLAGTDNFSGNLSRVAGENVGVYAIGQGTVALSSNYTLSFMPENLSITPRAVSVTADAQTKTYGNADPVFIYQINSGNLVGADAFSGTLNRAVGEDVGTYAILPGSLTLGSNYNLSLVPGQIFTIAPRNITVTATSGQQKVYGNADPVLTFYVTNGSVLQGDIFSGALARNAGENVGVKAISLGTLSLGINYNLSLTAGSVFNITPRPITITADAVSKTYGDADPVLTAQATNVVPGDEPTGFLTRAAGENVGNYVIGKGTYTYGSNYQETFVGADLTINKAMLTITVADKSREYGDANPVFTGIVSGQKFNESFTDTYSTAAVATSPVGIYSIIPSVSGSTLSNYTVVSNNGTLTINKATLTITADDKSREYGDANPTFTGAYIGQKNNETFAISGSSSAVATSVVGTYSIAPSANGNTLPNYNLVTNNGILTVGKATLTVTAANNSREYGDVNPTLTGTVSGQKNNESFTDTYSTAAVATSSIGTYDIVPFVNGATISNYNVVLVNGTLTINKAPLVINVANKNREYGIANPTLTGTVTGIKNGDVILENYCTTATQLSSIGTYPITATPTGNQLGNYVLTVYDGILTIGKATLTVTANNKTVQYSDAVIFDAAIDGFRNADGISIVSGLPTFTTSAIIVNGQVVSMAGNYSITPYLGTLNAANYQFSFVPGNLTVTKEFANVVYTGLEYFITQNANNQANVEFIANLEDENDGANTRGNISNAVVDFWTDATSLVFSNSSITGVPVGLVDPANTTVGSARTGYFTVQLNTNDVSNGGTTFGINADVNARTVDQYYNGSTTAASNTPVVQSSSKTIGTLITIAIPGKDYVNGGGHMVATNSFGTYAATANSKVNFGFTMKWNKSGKNIQGQTNVIFRRLENGIWKTYKIKSNAINTLGTANITGGRRADFNTKATLTDVTNQASPITISGNLDLSVQAFESTDPAFANEICMTLRNGNQVMFCSHWVSNNPTRKGLGNGSIKVLSSAPAPARVANVSGAADNAVPGLFEVFPNPFNDAATVRFALEKEQQFSLEVYDIRGTLVRKMDSGTANSGQFYEYKLDEKWLSDGIYFVRLITETGVKTLKTVKSTN